MATYVKHLTVSVGFIACLTTCNRGAPTDDPPSTRAATIPTSPANDIKEGGPPVARTNVVSNEYHGTIVLDAYRWLEDGDAPDVQLFSAQQNEYAQRALAKLPDVEAIREDVTAVYKHGAKSYGNLKFGGAKLFVFQHSPPKQRGFLVVMDRVDTPETARVIVDPNVLDPSGHTSVDWYVPSPDESLVAVSLSEGGSESGRLHIYDVASGQQVHEVIPRVNEATGGGDVAWARDGQGFFYTRYPGADEQAAEDMQLYMQVYFHKLGDPVEKDRYELGKKFPKIAEIRLERAPNSDQVLATVQKGDGGEFAFYLRNAKGTWSQFADYADKVVFATFGGPREILAITRNEAPKGKVIALSLPRPNLAKAQLRIPENEDAIVSSFGRQSLLATVDHLFVTYQLGGPSEIRSFTRKGEVAAAPQLLPISSVGGLTETPQGTVLFTNSSFLEPLAWYHFDPKAKTTTKTALANASPIDFSDFEVRREFATSKDGTKVPVNILMRKGLKRDGENPTVVTGYGGYGISLTPRFSASRGILLNQNVIYAIANLRGGSEYGDAWHRRGALTDKQNVFDDFTASVKHLVKRGYTQHEKVALQGVSNGGLLVGATIVQYPDLAIAAVAQVGIYDMLRVELGANGRFNIPEFGTVTNKNQFEALYAYSPYHHVADSVDYPATLFTTGENDQRVDPMQSRKMVARMQHATTSGRPILLRTTADSGHGSGSLDQAIAEVTDIDGFLFNQLGVKYTSPRAKPKQRL